MNDTLPPHKGMIAFRHPSMPGPASRMHQGGTLFVGYWNGGRCGDHTPPDLAAWTRALPDPHDYIDMHWDHDERHRVVELLRLGTPFVSWKGYSFCRCCKVAGSERSGNGTKCLTFDGTWVWPEGFAHYVDAHAVKPPQEFIDHVLNAPKELVAELRLHKANFDAIAAKWSPLYDSHSTCPDKGKTCKFEKRGEGSFYCEKKVGHGTTGSYQCLWASDNSRNAYTAERERHEAAMLLHAVNPWKD